MEPLCWENPLLQELSVPNVCFKVNICWNMFKNECRALLAVTKTFWLSFFVRGYVGVNFFILIYSTHHLKSLSTYLTFLRETGDSPWL